MIRHLIVNCSRCNLEILKIVTPQPHGVQKASLCIYNQPKVKKRGNYQIFFPFILIFVFAGNWDKGTRLADYISGKKRRINRYTELSLYQLTKLQYPHTTIIQFEERKRAIKIDD